MSSRRQKRRKKITVGTNVRFRLGGSVVDAIVIDDHGPIGPSGVRLLRVRVLLDDALEPLEGDVREDELSLIDEAA